ncbi:MAG: PAS domain-containing protein [Oligoflexia bacterium]|nr:PAS domain-containing protein [Oligoflexia bacterium]
MNSSILIVGHPDPQRVQFGADFATSSEEARTIVSHSHLPVLILATTIQGTWKLVLDEFRKLNPLGQIILVGPLTLDPGFLSTINNIGIFKLLDNFDSDSLLKAAQEALEEYELARQNESYISLIKEQNFRLNELSALLEKKVKAREGFLNQSKESLQAATRRTEALNRTLLAIQRGLRRHEIEQALNDALQLALGLEWTRISLKGQENKTRPNDAIVKEHNVFAAPLFRGPDLLGHIYFASPKLLTPEEDDFLLQIADAVALSIDRLSSIEAVEAMKKEWDSTFDSVTDPLALINSDYEIVRANKAYASKTRLEPQAVVGKKCHQVLFNLPNPCEPCRLGSDFQLEQVQMRDQQTAHFAVSSHKVSLKAAKPAFAVFYRDVSEEDRMKSQILESSKMAEIGTIGSSIAHEINNPLGGMIAFLQMLSSELNQQDSRWQDVKEMEKAALKCKDIVENLLAFSRQESLDRKPESVKGLIDFALKIMELQSRSLGIETKVTCTPEDLKVHVSRSQIVQVLVNVLQNSCESISDQLIATRSAQPGLISIAAKLIPHGPETHAQITIQDNGTGISIADIHRVFTPFFTTKDKTKNPGLGLSVSYQIVKDHGGQMEISSLEGKMTTVTVTLPIAKGPKH